MIDLIMIYHILLPTLGFLEYIIHMHFYNLTLFLIRILSLHGTCKLFIHSHDDVGKLFIHSHDVGRLFIHSHDVGRLFIHSHDIGRRADSFDVAWID